MSSGKNGAAPKSMLSVPNSPTQPPKAPLFSQGVPLPTQSNPRSLLARTAPSGLIRWLSLESAALQLHRHSESSKVLALCFGQWLPLGAWPRFIKPALQPLAQLEPIWGYMSLRHTDVAVLVDEKGQMLNSKLPPVLESIEHKTDVLEASPLERAKLALASPLCAYPTVSIPLPGASSRLDRRQNPPIQGGIWLTAGPRLRDQSPRDRPQRQGGDQLELLASSCGH